MFKANGADISIILRHDFIKPQKMNITSAFFAPFGWIFRKNHLEALTKTVNLNILYQGILLYFLLNKVNIGFKI